MNCDAGFNRKQGRADRQQASQHVYSLLVKCRLTFRLFAHLFKPEPVRRRIMDENGATPDLSPSAPVYVYWWSVSTSCAPPCSPPAPPPPFFIFIFDPDSNRLSEIVWSSITCSYKLPVTVLFLLFYHVRREFKLHLNGNNSLCQNCSLDRNCLIYHTMSAYIHDFEKSACLLTSLSELI